MNRLPHPGSRPRGIHGRLRSVSRNLRCDRGQALVEAAFVLPILLLILLALIESGNGLAVKHKMAVLSREGANIASRGSSLQETLDVVMAEGQDIDLSGNGGAIVSRISFSGGVPTIATQLSYPGFEGKSRLGLPDSVAVALSGVPFTDGQVLYAVEIIFNYKAMTPLAAVFPKGFADEVYERAVF